MKRIIIVLLLINLFGCNSRRIPIKTGFEGKPLPAFSLLLNDGSTYVNIASIQAGKPIVLFYFSPRCPYCRTQMGDIINGMATLENIRFYIFTTWPFKEMKEFYNHYQLNKYPNIIVGLDYKNFFVDYFKIPGVPYTAIYGKDRCLNKAFAGNIYPQQIKEVAEN